MSVVLAFVWAVGEATVWPIMPDAALVPLALARPERWWRLVLAAALGTAAGGSVSYLLGRRQPERSVIAGLPLVRPAMVSATERWLADEGPRGVWRQPATGVPFKVFARLAGGRRMPLVRFLVWGVAARTVRFSLLTGLAALIGVRWPRVVGRWFWWLTALWAIAFGGALWRLVTFWDHRSASEAASVSISGSAPGARTGTCR